MPEENDVKGRKRTVRLLGRLAVYNFLLIIVAGVLLALFLVRESQRPKFIFDGIEVANGTSLFKDFNGKKHINIDDFVNLHKMKMYKINTGKFNEANIQEEYFYIDSPYEAVQFDTRDKNFTKYIKYEFLDRDVDENGNVEKTESEKRENKNPVPREKTKIDKTILNQETFKLQSDIKKDGGKRYLTLEDAKYAFNINLRVSKNKKEILAESIKYLEKKVAGYLKSQNFELSSNYQNRRSIIDNYFSVVSAGKHGIQGVNDANASYENKVPVQYDDLRYSQNNKNIYCIKDEKIGIINILNRKNIIALGNYDNIEIYLEDKGIYKVGFNKRFGLLDSDGNKIVPIENDAIGYEVSEFPEVKDGKIFFDKLIPVKRDDKWGFYKADGVSEKIIDNAFDSLGFVKLKYVQPDSHGEVQFTEEQIKALEKKGIKVGYSRVSKEEALKYGYTTRREDIGKGDSVLIIPDNTGYGGIVVKRGETYGIVSSKAEKNSTFSLPPNYDKIYKYIDNGQDKYFAVQGYEEAQIIGGNNNTYSEPSYEESKPSRIPEDQKRPETNNNDINVSNNAQDEHEETNNVSNSETPNTSVETEGNEIREPITEAEANE